MKKSGLVLLIGLLIMGNVFFWSEIAWGTGSGTVTGMATKDGASTEDKSNIEIYFPVLLILIIIVNILYLASGNIRKSKFQKKPKNLKSILKLLNNTDIKTFNDHVNSEINHFADMVRMISPELAVKIYDITDKVEMAHIIEGHINKDKPTKSPEELKQEIIELKHELDTFDFGDFEKDL